MGVTQLWSVVQPCARPIKIETLNKKRLAVDSSLWIYQFLKAVRDKEGNALRNSHVVGFYRRICKLLYLGIKPVFVFDGGAPALKRQTIAGRKSRREGRREDAVRTAGKLLALQMQRRAEEEDQKRREAVQRPGDIEEEEVPDNPVYVDELQMNKQERQQNRKFKKRDQYDLPDLDVSLAEMGQPNDPRVMSVEELEEYARQFDSGEDINVYDFSKIDFDSPFFQSLPPSDRYNILNAARLRSRLRMGLSKDQLDTMFPDRMAFSRFQIDRVKERNELTQRLMHVNGMVDDPMIGVGVNRVAGERGREYVLVKNTGAEGGWALGVIADKDQGERNKPIDVDEHSKMKEMKEIEPGSEDDEEDAFEDVPIEGLNRLPKIPPQRQYNDSVSTDILKRREAIYKSRTNNVITKPSNTSTEETEDTDSLFIGQPDTPQNNFNGNDQTSEGEDEEEELQRAIAMSLENGGRISPSDDNDYDEVFQNGSVEQKASRVAPKPSAASRTQLLADDSDEDMEFENVLTSSRTSKNPLHKTPPIPEQPKSVDVPKLPGFEGPLPFEQLDLGSSILGKKKMKKIEEENAGGFERNYNAEDKKKQSAPLPPWFSDDLITGLKAQDNIEREDRERDRKADEDHFIFPEVPKLRKENSKAIIDLEAVDEQDAEPINIESSDDETPQKKTSDVQIEDTEIRMGDIADLARAEPPEAAKLITEEPAAVEVSTSQVVPPKSQPEEIPAEVEQNSEEEPIEWSESDREDLGPKTNRMSLEANDKDESEEEPIEWSESDREDSNTKVNAASKLAEPIGGRKTSRVSKSPSLEFEQVTIDDHDDANSKDSRRSSEPREEQNHNSTGIVPASGTAEEATPPPPEDSDEEQYYSEAEDEELMMQLATEAEEHARFASTLNQKTTQQNIEEYERELKALRSQQKKDRRDADEVTQVMITECQQLLKLFGLPYITAPMEAEAQCAELVSLGLVDGIVTDDSDVFLFGGTRIYKNMFNQAKYVECYLSSDLEREFDLTREKMIRIAHLLGSDYTEGLPGIGPVTALEIVSEFPNGLTEFKDWWTHVQTGAKPSEEDQASPFRKKFRRNAAMLFLPPTFPDARVDEAYLQPEVDADPSEFQWGVPDLDALRAFLMATIGWSPERTDEVLVPVIRDMNRRETEGTQANITRFITGSTGVGAVSKDTSGAGGANAFAPRRRGVGKSKRMEGALEKLAERARQKRKGLVNEAESQVNLADEQDRAVQADEALIAVQGSAVEGSPASKARASRNAASGSKRKVMFADVADDGTESEADMPVDRTKRKKTKPKKKAK